MKYVLPPILAVAIVICAPAPADEAPHEDACATIASQIGFYTAALAALKESAIRAETVAELVINHR